MQFTLYADGGSRGNPGPAGAGAIVRDETGETVVEVSEFLGHATNNIAEYTAVLRALEVLSEKLGPEAVKATVHVRLDSMLVVRQMMKQWKLKNEGLKPLAARVEELMQNFNSVSFEHVYREDNTDADRLANRAMDRGR
ncbi:ribonuclease HI family protein [Patescibacteria group bacterium]|nr:ribonuclease HI family protein [Patescibacteria group bacterium]MBU1500419.1 ribonuclease HI family protein [Patescibacteria group bacterium]MBU2080487.1 ribonuclease HI family protein [Patescibacteria group bacterium]MBU2123708.1 ribonuclease HI family protein [Patescibacteria group bacterium]MBU2194564.1 ribonuclease HI family protein [Patescibacteria group bacterium]